MPKNEPSTISFINATSSFINDEELPTPGYAVIDTKDVREIARYSLCIHSVSL